MSEFNVCECGHLEFVHQARLDCTAEVPINTTGDTRRCECDTFRKGR